MAAVAGKLEVAGFVFPPVVRPPGLSKTLFLGGAGERGLDIGGKVITFTTIGVYLEESAVESLSGKWKGKSGDDLAASMDFVNDVIIGPFEKFIRVTMVLQLTGQQYSEKVIENCIAMWKANGIYTEAEGLAAERFKEIFKTEIFPNGASILFTQSPSGSLTIGFSKDGSIPESATALIENKALSEAVLRSIIGEHGVSPTTRRSLAFRISDLLKEPYEVKKEMLQQEPNVVSV